MSKNNQSWSEQSVSDRLAELKQLVKTKTGRAMQKKATPIREAAVLIKPTTTMEDLKKLAAAYKEKFGINVFQIDIHKDEGHEDADGKWVGNLHAHVTADFIDHETGESLKLKPYQMSQLQDVTAEVLDMERGVSSNKQHLSALQFKIKAEREKLEELKKKVGPGAKLAALFKVGELAEIRSTLDKAVTASKSAEDGMKEAKKALSDAIEAHADELATAKKKSRQEGISDTIAAIKKAANLHIGEGGKETAEDIGKAWRRNYDQKKELQEKVDSLEAEKKGVLEVNKQSIENARTNMLKVVNHLLFRAGAGSITERDIENVEEIECTLGRSFGSMYQERKDDMCRSVLEWSRQVVKVNSGDRSQQALQRLLQFFKAMKEAWKALLAMVNNTQEEHNAVRKDVDIQLKFTPGIPAQPWQDFIDKTEQQYMSRYVDDEQEVQDLEQHIDQEQRHGYHY